MSDTHAQAKAAIQQRIRTENEVVLLLCGPYGAMEAAVANLTSPGDRVLVLAAENDRWASIAKAYNCEVDIVSRTDGAFDLEAVRPEMLLQMRLETRAIFVTGTGQLDALHALMLEVDSEAMLAVSTNHKEDSQSAPHADVLVGETGAAGLSYAAVSERAWDRMEATYNPRSYFDLRRERRNAGTATSLHRPSEEQLVKVLAESR